MFDNRKYSYLLIKQKHRKICNTHKKNEITYVQKRYSSLIPPHSILSFISFIEILKNLFKTLTEVSVLSLFLLTASPLSTKKS